MKPSDKITPHFTWHEALWLPSWRVYADPTSEEAKNIIDMAQRMERVRSVFGAPIHVHCWLRPGDYNRFVGGVKDSQHILGKAVDFHVQGFEGEEGCQLIREMLMTKLDTYGLRMEDKQGAWIHLDSKEVPAGGNRFFKP